MSTSKVRKQSGSATYQRGPLSVGELDALPVSVDLVTAGRAFRLSRETAYDLAAAGEFPCPVLRIGRRWVVPRAGLLRALGIEDTAEAVTSEAKAG